MFPLYTYSSHLDFLSRETDFCLVTAAPIRAVYLGIPPLLVHRFNCSQRRGIGCGAVDRIKVGLPCLLRGQGGVGVGDDGVHPFSEGQAFCDCGFGPGSSHGGGSGEGL